MRRKIFIIIGILVVVSLSTLGYVLVNQLSHLGNTTGGRAPDYPYFILSDPIKIKKIVVPKGTKLTYEEHFYKAGQQTRLMNEKKLTRIELPEGKTIDWGGVPVFMIIKFSNPEIPGFSVYPNFKQVSNYKKTKFSQLLETSSCKNEIDFTIKNTDDWSFNGNNITKVLDCGIKLLYYGEDEKHTKQEELYKELKNAK